MELRPNQIYHREHYKAHKEEYKERGRQYRQRPEVKEHLRKYMRKYRVTHLEKVRAITRKAVKKYNAAHPKRARETRLKAYKKFRITHPDYYVTYVREVNKRYRHAHPEKYRAKRNSGAGLSSSEKRYLSDPYQFKISYRRELYRRVIRKVLASVELLSDHNLESVVDSDVWQAVLALPNDRVRLSLLDTIHKKAALEVNKRRRHPEEYHAIRKRGKARHSEKYRAKRKQWRARWKIEHPEEYRTERNRWRARHKGKGFIPLAPNDWNCPVDWHHVSPNHPYVVPLPRAVHRKVYGKYHFVFNATMTCHLFGLDLRERVDTANSPFSIDLGGGELA